MKEDLHAALTYWTTVGDAITWLLIGCAALLTIGAGIAIWFLGLVTFDAIGRRHRIHTGIRNAETYANQPAPHIPAQTRKEKP